MNGRAESLRFRTGRGAEEGVAFLLVLGVLAGLLVLAGPFLAVAVNDRAAAGRTYSEAEVAAHAEGLSRYARRALERGHAAREAGESATDASDLFASPRWDTGDEFLVPLDIRGTDGRPVLAADGKPIFEFDDPRGRQMDLLVRDEQSLPNLWTATPFLISAYLARGTLTSDIEATSTELTLDTGEGFPLKNGALLIESERITYTERRGAQFLGLGRGVAPSGRARKHVAETWAIDDRAREIASIPWKSPRAGGKFREPISLMAAKETVLFGGAALTAVEIDKLSRNFNTTAWRYVADGFGTPRGLVGNIDPALADITDGFKLRVKSNDGMNAGAVVRITDGVNVDYGFVLQSQRQGAFSLLTLSEPTRNAYLEGRTFVAPLIRHPVNVNSCSEDLLVNLLQGLQLSPGGGFNMGSRGRISKIAAEIFAKDLVAARPIRGWDDLRNKLQTIVETWPLVTSPGDIQPIFRNAVDSGDWLLANSTVSLSFASYDRYRTEATVAMNDRSGSQTARRRIRETFRASPTFVQTFRLDSQEDFEESILRARWSPWFTTYPNPVERAESSGQTPASRIPRMLLFSQSSGSTKQSGTFAHKVEGDVRLVPGRSEPLAGFIEHFDGQAAGVPDNVDASTIDPDGWILENGPWTVPTRAQGGGRQGGPGGPGRPGGGGRQAGGSLVSTAGLSPVKVDFWFKTRQVGGRQVLFDLAGPDPDEQRAQLLIEADGTVRARLRDRTIPDPLTGFTETTETVFTPDAGVLAPETYFHAGISYRGTKPEDLQVWWDGFKRGKAKYSTTLTSTVRRGAMNFDAEDLADWPDRFVAWVGREAVECRKNGNTLQVIDYPGGFGVTGRGRRGTADIDHAQGEPVQLMGYSTPVVSQGDLGGVAIPRGGATLQSDLGPFNLASFTGNDNQTINLGPVLPGVPFEVLDPTKPDGNILKLVAAPGCVADFSCFQASGGYAVIVSTFSFLPGPLTTALAAQGFAEGAELVYYAGRVGATLTGLTDSSLPHFSGATIPLGGTTMTLTTVRTKHPTRLLGGSPSANQPLVVVFPVSIGLSSVDGYLEPRATTGGGGGNNPEFVSLGQPDLDNVSSHRIEWIRYFHRDPSRNLLLCDDPDRLGAAIFQADRTIQQQGGGTPWDRVNDALGFRTQLGTQMFGYGDPTSAVRHGVTEDVSPVFRVVQHDGIGTTPPPAGSPTNAQPITTSSAPAPGYGDSVTIEQAGGTLRKRFDVTWSADADVGFHGLVSVATSPGQVYTQGRLPINDDDRTRYTRLLKFPSGEMPAFPVRGTRARAGGDVDGGVSGSRLDELRITAFTAERYIVWDQNAMGVLASSVGASPGTSTVAVDESTDEIPICNVEWLISRVPAPVLPGGVVASSPQSVVLPDHRQIFFDQALRGFPRNDAGLVQIDDEVIAFRRVGTGRNGGPALLGCERGFMQTIPARHGFGAAVTYLDLVPVTMLSQAAAAADREFPVSSLQDFARGGGLALIDNELVHFTEAVGGRLRMPPRLDEQNQETGGLLRGRFGTIAAAHENESIVLDMPYRHWDRYVDLQDNPELAWYGFAIDAPGAYIESFAYEEFRPNSNVGFRAFVRTEPDQRWSDAPGAGLMVFDEAPGKDRPHSIDRRASIFEVRFMVRYQPGSFDPVRLSQHEWKSTPELRNVEVKFRDATRVYERETEK